MFKSDIIKIKRFIKMASTVQTTVHHDQTSDIILQVAPERHTALTSYRNPYTGKLHIITQHTPGGKLVAHNQKTWEEISKQCSLVWAKEKLIPKDQKTKELDKSTVCVMRHFHGGITEFDRCSKDPKTSDYKMLNGFYRFFKWGAQDKATVSLNPATQQALLPTLQTLWNTGKDDRQILATTSDPDTLKDVSLNTAATLWRDETKPLDRSAMDAALSTASNPPLKYTIVNLDTQNIASQLFLSGEEDKGYVVIERVGSQPPVGFIVDKKEKKIIFVDPAGKKLSDHADKEQLEKIASNLKSLLKLPFYKKWKSVVSDQPLNITGLAEKDQARALISSFIKKGEPTTLSDLRTHSEEIARTIQGEMSGPIPVATPQTPKEDLLNLDGRIHDTTIQAYCDALKTNHRNFSAREVIPQANLEKLTTSQGLYYYNTAGHYVFFFVDDTTQKIYYYDSKGINLETRKQSSPFREDFAKMLSHYPNYTIENQVIEQQTGDDIQCGPYGLLFTKAMLDNVGRYATFAQDRTLTPALVKEKRRELAAIF